MDEISKLCNIDNLPLEPLDLFTNILSRLEGYVAMNLATIDNEFGILNRTVVYRGLTDGAITFVTERNSRKYENLKRNPRIAVTFLFPAVSNSKTMKDEIWQIRLLNAEAFELDEGQLSQLWSQEPLFAKIRSHICECGHPVDHAELERKHNMLLESYKFGQNKLEQTKTYTAFKIIPQIWDFYMSEHGCIADRVQYKRNGDVWETCHVAA